MPSAPASPVRRSIAIPAGLYEVLRRLAYERRTSVQKLMADALEAAYGSEAP